MYSDSSTDTLFVPIDVGKNVNWYAAYAGYQLQEILVPCQVLNRRCGYQQLSEHLRSWIASQAYTCIVVGMEPTGVYHEAWAYRLQEDFAGEINLRLTLPQATKLRRQRQSAGRKRKTDRIDLDALAMHLRDSPGRAAFLPTEEDLRFEVWAQVYRRLELQMKRLGDRVLTYLDQLWPGMVVNVRRFKEAHPDLEPPQPLIRSRPLDRKLIRVFLQIAPHPNAWRSLSVGQIQSLLRETLGRCGPRTAEKVYRFVQDCLCPAPKRATILAERLQRSFETYLHLESRLQSHLKQAEVLVPGSSAAVLTTLPGMSAALAARYKAHVGPPGRFDNAAEVWSFAGFDPNLEATGDRRRIGQISRKGSPDFRDVLFLIGFHASRRPGPFKQARLRALAHGKQRVGAILHAAHKANRVCFHLYTHQERYDPRRTR